MILPMLIKNEIQQKLKLPGADFIHFVDIPCLPERENKNDSNAVLFVITSSSKQTISARSTIDNGYR